MHVKRNSIVALAATSLLALALAACGGSDNSSTTSAASGSSTAAGGDTVTTMSIGGAGNVLVDSQGAALYTNDMDQGSKIACSDACTAIWVPLAAPAGGQPTSSDSSVQDKLGTVKRPDGTTQVTFDGKPLYSFVQDSSGQVTGDGVSDSFGGTGFTWTVATGGGGSSASSGSSAATTTSGSSGGGYGGY
jgi:predicted lipoprotein with Yx(FWY)xxD motif